MSELEKELIQKLDALNKKLDTLIKVVAVSSRTEIILKGKKQKEQIKILSGLGLSRNLIALMVGTTPLTVSVTLSKMKKKKPKPKKTEKKAESTGGDTSRNT